GADQVEALADGGCGSHGVGSWETASAQESLLPLGRAEDIDSQHHGPGNPHLLVELLAGHIKDDPFRVTPRQSADCADFRPILLIRHGTHRGIRVNPQRIEAEVDVAVGPEARPGWGTAGGANCKHRSSNHGSKRQDECRTLPFAHPGWNPAGWVW